MEENFLDYLDKKYEQVKEANNIPLKENKFRHYETLKPLDFHTENHFFCLKMQKTKVLFCPSEVKIYLSDANIISIIINLKNEFASLFINYFKSIYKKEYDVLQQFNFTIGNDEFAGSGIPYTKSDMSFMLHSDNSMEINEFIFVLNMILEKDAIFSRVNKNDWIKRTLCKYISLIMYYKYSDENAEKFLLEINYPIEKSIQEIFIDENTTKKINKLFQNLELFEKSIKI